MQREIAALVEALGGAPIHAGPFARYATLVQTWNLRVNLTAAKEASSLTEVLFADAWMTARAQPDLLPSRAHLLDVGSGAGAPAIPCLLLREDLTATLMEPARKRVAFLRTAIGHLGLEDRAQVHEGRLDPEAPQFLERPVDVAMSRATWPPPTWLAIGAQLAPHVVVFATQGAPPAPRGWRQTAEQAYRLPSSGAPRTIAAYASDRLQFKSTQAIRAPSLES